MMSNGQIPTHVIDEMVRRYAKGESTTAIGRALGIHRATVLKKLCDAGADVKRKAVPQEKIDQARVLLEEGAGYTQAASVVGVSRHTLSTRLPGYGLSMPEIVERQAMGRKFARMEKKR